MASGEYAKLLKRIWGDPDFKALTADEQLLYLKLISQTDVSLCGVLTLATIRWAGQTSNTTQQSTEESLASLARKQYVFVDHETQEVLIRSYIRNDRGYKSPLTFKAITGAIGRVLSPYLRGEISRELERLDTSALSEKVYERYDKTAKQYVQDGIAHLVAVNQPFDTPPDTPWDTPLEGVLDDVLLTPTPAPTPAPAPAPAPTPHDSGESRTYSEQFENWWKHYPVKSGKKRAYPAFNNALKRASIEDITQGAINYATFLQQNPTQSPKYAEGWLNDDRWTDDYAQSFRQQPAYRNQNQIVADMQQRAAYRDQQQQSALETSDLARFIEGAAS